MNRASRRATHAQLRRASRQAEAHYRARGDRLACARCGTVCDAFASRGAVPDPDYGHVIQFFGLCNGCAARAAADRGSVLDAVRAEVAREAAAARDDRCIDCNRAAQPTLVAFREHLNAPALFLGRCRPCLLAALESAGAVIAPESAVNALGGSA